MAGMQYDAGHFSFLEVIKVLHRTAGPAFAKGSLIKTGVTAGKSTDIKEFATLEDFVASAENMGNPIAQFEGKAKHYGNGVFGLPACPFAGSIKTYKSVAGGMPAEYADVTAEMNRTSHVTDHLRVGEGAAVSPFCAVHQPIRSAMGERTKIAGKTMKIYQLGCKSGTGHKGLAAPWIEEAGVETKLVEKILDENMCCYAIRFESGE